MRYDDGGGTGLGPNGWRALVIGAFALIVVLGIRNYFVYQAADRPVPLWESMTGEIPIWIGWVLLTPLIIMLGRRWPPIGERSLVNGVLHVVAAFATSAVITLITVTSRMLLPNTPSPAPSGPSFWGFTLQVYAAVSISFLFVYASILGLALTWSYHVEQQRRAMRESRLETLLARSERDLLRMQIHPHFLFNTLNSISALMSIDVPAARRMTVSLSDLLRFSLDEGGGHEVTLDEELDLLARYLDIQFIRFQDRLTLETEIDPVTLPLLVPRLILQPLAENAFVHGFGSMEGPGTLTITSGMDAGNLVLTVSDDGAGIPRGSRDGLGLGNSRARLRHLYGDAAALTLEPRVPAGAMTRLIIPAHTEPVTTEADD